MTFEHAPNMMIVKVHPQYLVILNPFFGSKAFCLIYLGGLAMPMQYINALITINGTNECKIKPNFLNV